MDNVIREAMMRLLVTKPAGMSVREFCKENNLKEYQYFFWRNRLIKENQPVQKKGFTPIQIKYSMQSKDGLLASLALYGEAALTIYDTSFIASLGSMISF